MHEREEIRPPPDVARGEQLAGIAKLQRERKLVGRKGLMRRGVAVGDVQRVVLRGLAQRVARVDEDGGRLLHPRRV